MLTMVQNDILKTKCFYFYITFQNYCVHIFKIVAMPYLGLPAFIQLHSTFSKYQGMTF